MIIGRYREDYLQAMALLYNSYSLIYFIFTVCIEVQGSIHLQSSRVSLNFMR